LRHKEDSAGRAAERRPKARKQVLLTGIVAAPGGVSSVDCTIRDLSETGAKIVAAYEAQLVRSDASEAGVVFHKTLPLSGLTDPALGFLKRMWLSKAAR
jgi:hypothetical protein